MNEHALNARIDSLEERVAFQEQTIEDLSKALTEQWMLLQNFKRDVSRLSDELKAVEDGVMQGDQREPPPPHY